MNIRYGFVNSYTNINAPGRTRTCGTWVRNPLLYPAELQAHNLSDKFSIIDLKVENH